MSTVTEIVRERYAEAAKQVASGRAATCCGSSGDTSGGLSCCDPITGNLYSELEAGQVPGDALLASLGCGNPTALAALRPGQTVLDLGSGGGIDVILSARRVGPTGKAYGLDMTDEMLTLARANAAKAEAGNVEFLKGHIEAVPLPNDAVDVIISNCVINLSADKARVIGEAFRVLKPGGRFAVSDVVLRGQIPDEVRRSMELWVGCVAGALTEEDYRSLLTAAGFTDVDIETTRVYYIEDARAFLSSSGLDVDTVAPLVQGRVTSAFIRATKPQPVLGACCGPDCCP
jgi:SAM-dependent methyltransferase